MLLYGIERLGEEAAVLVALAGGGVRGISSPCNSVIASLSQLLADISRHLFGVGYCSITFCK